MAIWSTLAAWVVVLVVIAARLLLVGRRPVLIEWARWFARPSALPRAIVAALLVLGCLMLGTWKMLVQSLYIGLTGREWLIKTSGFVWLVFFMASGRLSNAICGQHRRVEMAVGQLADLSGVLVVLKMIAAIVIATRLSRAADQRSHARRRRRVLGG